MPGGPLCGVFAGTLRAEGETDILALAIRLGVATARNPGFNDGNKRTGAVSLMTILRLNG